MSTTATLRTAASQNTVEARKERYYELSAEISTMLGTLHDLVQAHGATAAGGQYHWGSIGDLEHIKAHLAELMTTEE